MNFRTIFSDMQMTTLLVILLQILSSTHMLPITSPSRKSELDLLIDPVYQASLDSQETKRVVAKSVYNTPVRVTQGQGCPQDMQRVKPFGPCVTRHESSSGPSFDETYLLAALKNLHGQGGSFSSASRRKRPTNRHRGSTTPKSTTTTDLPVEVSTLQELEGGGGLMDFVDMTSTSSVSPFKEVSQAQLLEIDPERIFATTVTVELEVKQDTEGVSNETGLFSTTLPSISFDQLGSSDFQVKPQHGESPLEINITAIDSNPINTTIQEDVKDEKIQINFPTTTHSPIQLTVDMYPIVLSGTDDEGTLDKLTTIKPDLPFIKAQNENVTSDEGKLGQAMGQNVTVTLPDNRVISPENYSDESLIFINNTAEDPGVSFYNQDEESSTKAFTSPDPELVGPKMDQVSPGGDSSTDSAIIESLMEANDSSAAATLSSLVTLEDLEERKLEGFNYTGTESDNLMTDISTTVVPDMEEFGITSVPSLTPMPSSKTSASHNSSEIDSTTNTALLGTPDEVLAEGMMAQTESDDKVMIVRDAFEASGTTPPTLPIEESTILNNEALGFEESTTVPNIPEVLWQFESQLPDQIHIQQGRLTPSDASIELAEAAEPTISSEIEGELDRIHHRSRTRNRIKNPDFSESPQEEAEAALVHDSRGQVQDELARDLQSQSRSLTDPVLGIGMVGSSYRYPQQFVSLDYLRLGENYRRFRVF